MQLKNYNFPNIEGFPLKSGISTISDGNMSFRWGKGQAEIKVFMGPSIQKKSFVVPDPFQRESAEWQKYVVNLDERMTAIDMIGFLKAELLRRGISERNLFVSEVDTYKEGNLFSHRRSVVTGEVEGRFAVAVAMI